MKDKRLTGILTIVLMLALCRTAFASGAPTSQFGFSGWPYRGTGACGEAQPDMTPEACVTPEPTAAPVIPATPRPIPDEIANATAAPPSEPTKAPAPVQTPVTAPTTAPTIAPTEAPTKAPAPTQKPSAPSTGGDYTTVGISAQEENAYSLLSKDRANNGLPALTLDPALCALARLKSCDMNAGGYFAHTSPTLGSAAQMLKDNGYAFTSVGENIAHHSTVEKAQAAFMSSSGHRRNILGSQWSKVGIGICRDSRGFVYMTQLFVR